MIAHIKSEYDADEALKFARTMYDQIVSSGEAQNVVNAWKKVVDAFDRRLILKIDEHGRLCDVRFCCHEMEGLWDQAFSYIESTHKVGADVTCYRNDIEEYAQSVEFRFCGLCGAPIEVERVRSVDYPDVDLFDYSEDEI